MNKPTASPKELVCFEWMSKQLSRIESSPNVFMNQFEGRWGMKYVSRTNIASDFCFYFAPNVPELWTLSLRSVARLRKSVDRFMDRIGYSGEIPLDLLPNNYGCEICNSQKGADQNPHQNHCQDKTHNQNNCDEQ